jgi:probable F420-dependent oxidoreductase
MKFSVWPAPERPWSELRELALWADLAGWHGFWYPDHYMPNTDDGDASDGDAFECWSILASVATLTQRLRVGSLVSPTTVHHPAILAKRSASLDAVSGGRIVIGLGAGWQVNEHRAYGIELFEPRERVNRFEEAVQILRSLLTQHRTTFAGRHFNITDAPCQPRPVQTPIPLLVGASSPRMLRITARYADEWNTWGDIDAVRKQSEAYLAACDDAERDPSSTWRSLQALVHMSDDEGRLARLRERPALQPSIIGSPAQMVETLGRLAELGVDEFIVPDFTFGRDHSQRLETYSRFHAEVVAHFV